MNIKNKKKILKITLLHSLIMTISKYSTLKSQALLITE